MIGLIYGSDGLIIKQHIKSISILCYENNENNENNKNNKNNKK